MQRARERDTLAKATANAEAQAEAKKAAERWVALPEEAEASNDDDEEKKRSVFARDTSPRPESTETLRA